MNGNDDAGLSFIKQLTLTFAIIDAMKDKWLAFYKKSHPKSARTNPSETAKSLGIFALCLSF